MANVEIQQGEIKIYKGSTREGFINYSNLEKYRAKTISKHYSIKYVIKGSERYEIEGEQHVLKAGQFLFVRPHEEVKAEVNERYPAQGVCIYIAPEVFKNKLERGFMKEVLLPDFPIDCMHLGAQSFFERLSSSNAILNADLFLDSCTDYFTEYLIKNNQNLRATKAEKTSTKRFLWRNVERARQFMHQQMRQKLKLKDIANEACLSSFHFQRIFKAFYRVSPAQYLSNIRMQKAVLLIREAEMNMADIADLCGFDDVKYFKKCVKKYCANLK